MRKHILNACCIVPLVLLTMSYTEEEIRPQNDTRKGIAGNIR